MPRGIEMPDLPMVKVKECNECYVYHYTILEACPSCGHRSESVKHDSSDPENYDRFTSDLNYRRFTFDINKLVLPQSSTPSLLVPTSLSNDFQTRPWALSSRVDESTRVHLIAKASANAEVGNHSLLKSPIDADYEGVLGIPRDCDALTVFLRSETSRFDLPEIVKHITALGTCWNRPTDLNYLKEKDHLPSHSSVIGKADSGYITDSVYSSSANHSNGYLFRGPQDQNVFGKAGTGFPKPLHHNVARVPNKCLEIFLALGGNLREPRCSSNMSVRPIDSISHIGSERRYSPSISSRHSSSDNVSTKSSDTEIDHFSECETSGNDSFDNLSMNSTISYLTHGIVDRLMNDIHFFFDSESGIIKCTIGTSNSNRPVPNGQTNSGNGKREENSFGAGRKRPRGQDCDPDPPDDSDDEDDDEDNGDKRRKFSVYDRDEYSPESAYERYCRRELPRRVRAGVEKLIQEYVTQIGKDLGVAIEAVVRESYDGVKLTYQRDMSASADRAASISMPANASDLIAHGKDSAPTGINDASKDSLNEATFQPPGMIFEGAINLRSLELPATFIATDVEAFDDTLASFSHSTRHMGFGCSFDNLDEPIPPSADLWHYINSGASSSTLLPLEQELDYKNNSDGIADDRGVYSIIPPSKEGLRWDNVDLLPQEHVRSPGTEVDELAAPMDLWEST
ncbi:uncharacterized protein BDZ99DRAFT_522991 [Mytilinidion resinicola]|uniref:Uncharacterized protein n=1 Tax=Mytilinidion resinicola TaxID=574789 RepID=A0A6A6YF04_9PEZI|nr:uncharacterized protein BDZ99DRAFT_522991 [Mytilinidion resinicola]KAF2807371.1 hypothetical protein BDZ99DRAFT_522991 [Mytilinidion resinicola]